VQGYNGVGVRVLVGVGRSGSRSGSGGGVWGIVPMVRSRSRCGVSEHLVVVEGCGCMQRVGVDCWF
jgi:hypothetical protein